MKKFRTSLVFLDIFAMYVGLVLAVIVRGTLHAREVQTLGEWLSAHTIIFLPSVLFSLLAMYVAGLYDVRMMYERAKVVPLIIYAQITSALFSVLFFYAFHTTLTPKLTLFLYTIFSMILLVVVRSLTLSAVTAIRKGQAVYLIAADSPIHSLEKFNQPYALFLLSQMTLSQFLQMSTNQRQSYDAVIYDETLTSSIENFVTLEKLKREGLLCMSNEEYYEDLYKKVDLETFDQSKFTNSFAEKKEHAGHYLFRRFLDITAAIFIFPFFILTLPFVTLLNFLFNRGPLFSVQDRVGILGSQIWVYKLRTMLTTDTGGVMTADGLAQAHAKSQNSYTKIGNIWRKTRIDEFPQWINLLRGDISIIGPRADIVGVYKEMSEGITLYPLRLVVPQGLTGWAQVHMAKPPRTKEEHTERLAYELYYIKNRSILLDISIILKTIKTMIARTGA